MPKLALNWLSSIFADTGLRLSFAPSAFRLTVMLVALVLPYFKVPIRRLPLALSAFNALKSSGLSLCFLSSFAEGGKDAM